MKIRQALRPTQRGSSSIAHGSALGAQIQITMRPVWAIHNANAVNPLKNRGYAV